MLAGEKGVDMSVYERIYDTVSSNLEQTQVLFEYKKSTFLNDVKAHPQVVDVSRFLSLGNPEFVEAIHVAALKRLPEKGQIAFWEQRYDWSKEEFQREVLKSIARSSVVAINHIRLINNPYFQQKSSIRYRLLGTLYGLTDKSSLREFGKKLPQPIQRIIRKLFL